MSNLFIRRVLGSRPLAMVWRPVAVTALTIVLFQCQPGVGQATEEENVQLIQLYVDAAGDLAVYPERLVVGPKTEIVIGTLGPEGELVYERLKTHEFLFTLPPSDKGYFEEPKYKWGTPDKADDALKDKKKKKLHVGNKTDQGAQEREIRELVSVFVKSEKDLKIVRPIVVPYTLLHRAGGNEPWYAVRGSEVIIDPNRTKTK